MRGNKKIVIGLLLICLLGITGCESLPKGENEKERKETVQETILQEENDGLKEQKPEDESKKEPAATSIAYTDWKIKESLLAGTDNVYELKLEELLLPDEWIMTMEPYAGQVLVMKQAADRQQHFLYLVNPLTVEITAAIELPAGIFNPEDLMIDDGGFIRVCNMEPKEIYIFNGMLEEVDRIELPAVSSGSMFLTQDRKRVYYADYERNAFSCYHVDTGEQEEVISDIELAVENGDVIGLLADETCLAFNYYDMEQDKFLYEIRNLNSNEVVYRDIQAIMDVSTCGNDYMLTYEDDSLYERIYGENWTNQPKVLAFKSYEEYSGCRHTCLGQGAFVNGVCTKNAEAEYEAITGSVTEGMAVSKISFSQYDLKTGECPYGMDFYYVEEGAASVYQCDAVFLKAAECVICYIAADEPRWLVWDLTKESSLSGDLQNYLYDWQKLEHPNEEVLARLKERADEIGKDYGVEIYIGEEVSACPADIYKYEVSNNIIRIKLAFSVLEKTLKKYPQGMLAQLGGVEDRKLQIYLADSILPADETAIDTSIGVQNTIDGITFLVLDINEWRDLENTIYHEIFHAIEQYLNMNENAFFDYEIWNSLNPAGFVYDNDYHINEKNMDWSDVAFETEGNAYFIDLYSKSFPGEDRARIMEYAMLDDTDMRKESLYCEGILQKLRYISEQIRKGFDTSNWPETVVWEEALQKTLLLE